MKRLLALATAACTLLLLAACGASGRPKPQPIHRPTTVRHGGKLDLRMRVRFGDAGNPIVGEVLTTTNGTWTDSPTTYTYQWQDCKSTGQNCVAIGGATSRSYTVQNSDLNDTIAVVVTAYNASGSGLQRSAPTGVVTSSDILPVGDPSPGKWTLAFDDEFNGSSIDATKWTVFDCGTGGICHTNNGINPSKNDCTETGGHLVLDVPGDGTGCNISSAYAPYTGGTSGANAWELKPGDYTEARVWVSGNNADNNNPIYNWPAWWTGGANWPDNGEYDLAEGLGKLAIIYHFCGVMTPPHCASGDETHDTGLDPTPVTIWPNSWHVEGVYETSTQALVYWDGTLVKTITLSPNDQRGPQALRFTLGAHGNSTDHFGSAYDMKVDYVRGWTGG